MAARADEDRTRQPHALLASLAPKLMHPRILASPAFHHSYVHPSALASLDASLTLRNIARARLLLPPSAGGRSTTPAEFIITDPERIQELLRLDAPSFKAKKRDSIEASSMPPGVPLLAGFAATVPSASEAKARRRKRRAGLGQRALGLEGEQLGLRKRVDEARGLLTLPEEDEGGREGGVGRRRSVPSSAESRRARKARRQTALGLGSANASTSSSNIPPQLDLSISELEAELEEIALDRHNLATRRALLMADMDAINVQIARLQSVHEDLESGLLRLKEDELELMDEHDGVSERLEARRRQPTTTGDAGSSNRSNGTSRRRKGPAFLPSEHDELPPGIAFMTLTGHSAPLLALDFSEPYGTLVTAAADETVRLWDLTTGYETGRLRGHQGNVKCLQVEGTMAVTGGEDGKVRLWDVEAAEEEGEAMMGSTGLGEASEHSETAGDKSCLIQLEGHTRAVTSLYFDSNCLVTGSSDKTLRQWDPTTGQAVLTMDILWAMQNPASSLSLSASPPVTPPPSSSSSDPFSAEFGSPTSKRISLGNLRRLSSGPLFANSGFAASAPPLNDGSWDVYQDFVGAVQFWGYALASGSGDGCVRMWDMRTGQAHRTLVGHTGPVTCLQFDEWHLVSGSLDHSIRVWDLRTGAIADTLRYEQPVTALQFDTRKIVAATGENAARIFNRTTLQQSLITVNGHTSTVEKLRYVDRYMATGARDRTVKIWAL